MSTERVLVWLVAAAVCVAAAFAYGGILRPSSSLLAIALAVLVALPFGFVFGRFLLSFRPVERGWR